MPLDEKLQYHLSLPLQFLYGSDKGENFLQRQQPCKPLMTDHGTLEPRIFRLCTQRSLRGCLVASEIKNGPSGPKPDAITYSIPPEQAVVQRGEPENGNSTFYKAMS